MDYRLAALHIFIVTNRNAANVQFTGSARDRGREKNSWQIKFLKTTRYLF